MTRPNYEDSVGTPGPLPEDEDDTESLLTYNWIGE